MHKANESSNLLGFQLFLTNNKINQLVNLEINGTMSMKV